MSASLGDVVYIAPPDSERMRSLCEAWMPTNGLRFVNGRLQQLWQSTAGNQMWEDVPTVDEP